MKPYQFSDPELYGNFLSHQQTANRYLINQVSQTAVSPSSVHAQNHQCALHARERLSSLNVPLLPCVLTWSFHYLNFS